MRICYIVDARSPIAHNWIAYFVSRGHEVHVISSCPCSSESLPVASLHLVPIAFSGVTSLQGAEGVHGFSLRSRILAQLRGGSISQSVRAIRHWLAPLEIYRHVGHLRKLVQDIQPDLVHAMRIPYEGALASLAVSNVPLLISVWGNDFTLHAKHYPLVAMLTRRAMQRTNALHCDCFRDLRLARTWGFPDSKPAIVLPGAGGVQLDVFYPGFGKDAVTVIDDNVPLNSSVPVVINPRGFRGYVRNDTFFRAIPLILKQRPDVIFLGVAMKGNPVSENWVKCLGISHAVHLLRPVPHTNMADLFRLADVSVSPSEHDGTPNTLLEAMACGCFPVAGDIESVREWIIDGVNGLLCDPTSPESLAQAVLCALSDAELRQRARETNLKLIAERAEYGKVMAQAEVFYQEVAKMQK